MRVAWTAALVALAVAAVASAQAPPQQGVIVFSSNRASNVWAADLMLSEAGRRPVNLTRSLGIHDRDADLSPTSREVVFSRRKNGSEDLFTLTIPGKRLAQLTFTPREYETEPVYSPDGGAIAFVRGTLHNDDAVWIVDRAGKERRLTEVGGFLSGLAWSPDGSRLTFSETNSGVFVIGRDGSGLRRVQAPYRSDGAPIDWLPAGIVTTQSFGNSWRLIALDPERGSTRRIRNPCAPAAPVFSSDRTHVVCHSGRRRTTVHIRALTGRLVRTVRIQFRGEHRRVQRFSLGPRGRMLVHDALVETRHADLWLLGPKLRRLTANHFDDHSAALSPDRRRVAFVRSAFDGGQPGGADDPLMLAETRTRRVRPLCGLRGTHPSWSPDGRSLAFARAGDIHVVDAGRCRVTRLTRGRAFESDPDWSHDGRRIAFVRTSGAVWSILLIPARGGRAVSAYTGSADDPAWSPDDRSIAFAAGGIRVIALATREVRTLVPDEDNRAASPTWSPDGRTIAFSSGWQFLPRARERAHNLRISAVDLGSGAVTTVVDDWGLHSLPDWR